MFIAFEGPEGSGKSTQIALLAGWLHERGLAVLTTREPGGTAIGDRVRAILLDHAASEMSPEAEVLLFSAARAQLVNEVIRPHLEAGGVVLCDRFADSTMAYQGYGHRLPLDKLATITDFATGGLRPALVAYLDIDVQAGLGRKQQHAQDDAGQWNRMEAKALAFHERVRAGYLAMAAKDPSRWLIVDAGQSVEDVQGFLRSRVVEMLAIRPSAIR